MEPYYYQKMNKPQQAAYHAMQQGVLALADEIQLPRIPAEELYDVFFRLRLAKLPNAIKAPNKAAIGKNVSTSLGMVNPV